MVVSGVDDLVDFVRVVRILGVIFYHLEAHREIVESASEVGFPPGLIGGELIDFPAGHRPRPEYLAVLITAVPSGVVLPGDSELVSAHIAQARVLACLHLLYEPAGELGLWRALHISQ